MNFNFLKKKSFENNKAPIVLTAVERLHKKREALGQILDVLKCVDVPGETPQQKEKFSKHTHYSLTDHQVLFIYDGIKKEIGNLQKIFK